MKEELLEIFQTVFVPKLDVLSEKIDDMKDKLSTEINDVRKEVNDVRKEVNVVRKEMMELGDRLNHRIDELDKHLSLRIDETNREIGRLYSVIVRREEHHDIKLEVHTLRREMDELKQRLAAS